MNYVHNRKDHRFPSPIPCLLLRFCLTDLLKDETQRQLGQPTSCSVSNPPISQSSNPAIRQKRGRRQSEWSMSIHFYFLFFSRYIVASFCSLADVPSVRLLRLHFVCGKATQRNTKFGLWLKFTAQPVWMTLQSLFQASSCFEN